MNQDARILKKLEEARKDLLDLSARNRLLNTPRHKKRSRSVEIVDEFSFEIFNRLVVQRKTMKFLPGESPDEEGEDEDTYQQESLFSSTGQPLEEQPDEEEVAERHSDSYLQTQLDNDLLQKRLLSIYYDSRTYYEEQGVNLLYIALGFLKWTEALNSDIVRYAPLVLVPVVIDRGSAQSKFAISFSEDEIATNLCLQAKLQVEFGLELPSINSTEELDLRGYFDEVERAIGGTPRWEVLRDDALLGFFSFSKLLMYRDLDSENWPSDGPLKDRGFIRSLLVDGFKAEAALCGDDERIDEFIEPRDMIHIMDADSSQAVAIAEVRKGRNLVIQGPPGTGKSQTIANMIAAAVADGKTVLFIAEKMAALEVVERRLRNVGLADMCLSLHSCKSQKKQVLEGLAHTLSLARPRCENDQDIQRLHRTRDALNKHVESMHRVFHPCELTPYRVIGELVRLRQRHNEFPSFTFDGAAEWSVEDRRIRHNLLEDVCRVISEAGVPAQHHWRGAMLPAVLPSDIARIRAALSPVISDLKEVQSIASLVASQIGYSVDLTAGDVRLLANTVRHYSSAPELDKTAISHSVWDTRDAELSRLLQTGQAFCTERDRMRGVVPEEAWTSDVTNVLRDIATHGRSIFRIFNRDYRQAIKKLRGILISPPPRKLNERLEILRTLTSMQQHSAEINAQHAIGEEAFGSTWRTENSNWIKLAEIEDWVKRGKEAELLPDFRKGFSNSLDMTKLQEWGNWIDCNLSRVLETADALCRLVNLDYTVAFNAGRLYSVPLSTVIARFEAWNTNPDSLSTWISLRLRLEQLQILGLSEIAEGLFCGRTRWDTAPLEFDVVYFESIIRRMIQDMPDFTVFDGRSHQSTIASFRSLDKQRIEIARQEVALAHHNRIPTGDAGIGEVGIVRHEIRKKRRHLAVRQLLAVAGRAIQQIKPVFLMSPLSVAQYLEPGQMEFDLLIIDEASQIRPVDALGAAARSKQMVVVGDEKQLPPTTFFMSASAEDSDSSYTTHETHVADLESILGLCDSQGMSQRMLNWHYRSRHHSLIAVSNREFYDDKLFVIPSPQERNTTFEGLHFRYIEDGVFDRGGSVTNRIEARRVADAVVEHARRHPKYTLGVGTFSVAQREAILDELELRRRNETDIEQFFRTDCAEPFFVKNLETIQGDERDVIFVSVGYGKDNSGFMAMNFGPLSNQGGERRLNVLITRSRRRCDVFSSITSGDIDLRRATGIGPRALRTFLAYAEGGILDAGSKTDRPSDSAFEESVAKALRSAGHEVDLQVGVAGFFIDLAIIDPEKPGSYLIGIECDGAAYHRARSARDRDRLREQVLRDHGWEIYRIWSTDWFYRPEEQLQRALAAIDIAKAKRSHVPRSSGEDGSQHEAIQIIEINREDIPPQIQGFSNIAIHYEEAIFVPNSEVSFYETRIADVAGFIAAIVSIEAPIHEEEIIRRVSSLWGFVRTGNRIREKVQSGIRHGIGRNLFEKKGAFLSMPGTLIRVRDRSEVISPTLRDAEMLPPDEVDEAVCLVVRQGIGVAKDDVVTAVARVFGFRSTGNRIYEAIQERVHRAINRGLLIEREGRLYFQTS